MKNSDKILIISATTSLAIAGLVLVIVGKKKKSTYRRKERLDRIAEEGYEFAADILYPLNNGKRYKSDYDGITSSAY